MSNLLTSRQITAWLYDSLQRLYSEAPYRIFKSGRAFPAWHYIFEMTRRCNLRCRMCQYISFLENCSGAEQRAGELTTAEWKQVIAQTGRLSFITFTGGEPLVREDFWELLEYASRRAHTHYITNATLLKEEAVANSVRVAPRRLGGRGLNFIGVSLEGPADLHDHIRRQPGAFERSAEGIRLLNAYRTTAGKQAPVVHITTVMQAANVDALAAMPALVARLGADTLNLVTETRMHDVSDLGEQPVGAWTSSDVDWPRIDRAKLQQALEATTEAARDHGVTLRLPRMPREEVLRYYEGQIDVAAYTCRSPWNTLIVGRTGDAYPCWLRKVGNVREHTLKEIWNAEETRRFRKACRNHLFPLCPGCCFIEYCGRKS